MSDEKYRAILEKDPTDTQAFVALCNSAERNNDYPYLVQLYDFRTQVIADSKEIADLHFKAGEIYLDKLNEMARGVESLLKGFESDRTHAGIGDRLDMVYREAGDWESAIQIAEQRLDALAKADANGTKLVIRSDLHQQAGEIWEKVYADKTKALMHYKKAIELDKTNILAIYGAREIYYEAGKYKNAAKLCELEARSERDVSRRSALYRELAQIFEKKLSNTDQAIIALKRALKFDPKNRELKIELADLIQTTAVTAENEKDHKWAREYLKRAAAADETGGSSIPSPAMSMGPGPLVRSSAPAQPAVFSEAPQQPATVMGAAHSSAPAAHSFTPPTASVAPAAARLSRGAAAPSSQPAPAAARQQVRTAPSGAVPARPAGLTDEEYAAQLRMAADKARRTGDEDAAEDCLREVLNISPFDQKATTYLERRYRARSDWASLRDLLLQSASASHLPQAVRTVRLREAARLSEEQLSDVEGAIDAWRIIKEHDPKVRDATDALIRLLDQGQLWDELITLLHEEAEETKSRAKKIEAYRNLANIYYSRLDNLDAAADAFKVVLELAPDDPNALESLDKIYTQNGRFHELVAMLRKRADLTQQKDEKRNFLYRAAVVLREKLGLTEEAYGLAKEILSFTRNDYGILEFMTSLDEEAGNWGRLLTLLDIRIRVAQNVNEQVNLLRQKATVAMENLADNRTAVASLKELLAVAKNDTAAMTLLAQIYREDGDWESLVGILDTRIKSVTDPAEKTGLHREMARVLEQKLGKEDLAMKSWMAVLDFGADSESLGALARSYKRNQNWSGYVDLLERQATYAEDHKERAQILFDRAAIIDEKIGDRESAVKELKRVLNEVDPTHEGSLNLLTDILVEQREFAEAADVLEQRISYTQDSREVKRMLIQLGEWSRDELNDLERSMEAFERAIQIDREDENLLRVLDRVYVALKEWDKLLKMLYAEVKKTGSEREKAELLTRGARICEEELGDKKKAWTWYLEMLNNLGHLPQTVDEVEQAARRMELWNELIDLAAEMTRKSKLERDQVEWWLKAADVFEENLSDAPKALEAVLRAFGLDPDNEQLLDRVDRLAVRVGNWQRLATVYGVLVQRAKDNSDKIALLKRYAMVLKDKADRPSDAFDVAVKAFELDPNSDELLATVEEVGHAAERWEDLVKIYHACARMAKEVYKKVDLKLRAAVVLRDKCSDPDGALLAILDTIHLDPFDDEILTKSWNAIQKLEDDLTASQKGTYWAKLIEAYQILKEENRRNVPNQIELLFKISNVYLDKINDVSAAFDCLKETQQLNPKDESIIDRLEAIAAKKNFWEELAGHYQDILDETFEMDIAIMLHRRRARILEEELDRLDEAAEHYWQIIQLDSTDSSGYDKLLSHYEKAGKWNELVNMLERQLDNTKDEADKKRILLKIASIWEENIGNRYEAQDWYEQVITIWPDDESAMAGLARLKGDAGGSDASDDESEADDDDLDLDLTARPAHSTLRVPPPPLVAPKARSHAATAGFRLADSMEDDEEESRALEDDDLDITRDREESALADEDEDKADEKEEAREEEEEEEARDEEETGKEEEDLEEPEESESPQSLSPEELLDEDSTELTLDEDDLVLEEDDSIVEDADDEK